MVTEVFTYAVPTLLPDRLTTDDERITAEPIWRGLLRRGFLYGDIVHTDDGLALQPHAVTAPWLLLHPTNAALISAAYERIYPGALDIPASAMSDGDAWYRWCTGV